MHASARSPVQLPELVAAQQGVGEVVAHHRKRRAAPLPDPGHLQRRRSPCRAWAAGGRGGAACRRAKGAPPAWRGACSAHRRTRAGQQPLAALEQAGCAGVGAGAAGPSAGRSAAAASASPGPARPGPGGGPPQRAPADHRRGCRDGACRGSRHVRMWGSWPAETGRATLPISQGDRGSCAPSAAGASRFEKLPHQGAARHDSTQGAGSVLTPSPGAPARLQGPHFVGSALRRRPLGPLPARPLPPCPLGLGLPPHPRQGQDAAAQAASAGAGTHRGSPAG